jgi:hypothetical protein
MARNRNRIKICGKNTRTAPTPAVTPLISRLWIAPSGTVELMSEPTAAKAPSMASMTGAAQV